MLEVARQSANGFSVLGVRLSRTAFTSFVTARQAPIFDGDRVREPIGPMASIAVLVPRASLRVERTWDVAGLRGTGSHTLAADDVFIPASRRCSVGKSSNCCWTYTGRVAEAYARSLVGVE